ncbi:MAG: BlaI/MecI/CopY family transcriptional regulator [Planctomycetota bacterium]
MARRGSDHPTPLELEILKIVWGRGTATAPEVREALASGNEAERAPSSVITMLNIMVEKGYLARAKEGRGYRYSPVVQESEVHQGMLGDLVRRLFGGSTRSAVLALLETGDLDSDELSEIRRLIQRKAKEGQ